MWPFRSKPAVTPVIPTETRETRETFCGGKLIKAEESENYVMFCLRGLFHVQDAEELLRRGFATVSVDVRTVLCRKEAKNGNK